VRKQAAEDESDELADFSDGILHEDDLQRCTGTLTGLYPRRGGCSRTEGGAGRPRRTDAAAMALIAYDLEIP